MTDTCQLPRRIAAVSDMHRLLKGYYDRHSVDERTAFCLDMAAEEIFTNMVRHNESAEEFISMTIDISDDCFRLRWIDRGVEPFDPSERPQVDLTRPIDEREPGGLGLYLTQSVMDRVTYTWEDGDMKVDVLKKMGA
jgi:anti-sigma regulatory factor (Ser/Thr protein kinase)